MCRKEVAWKTIVPCKSAFLKLKIDRGAYEHYIDGCESISSPRGKLSSFFSRFFQHNDKKTGVLGSVRNNNNARPVLRATFLSRRIQCKYEAFLLFESFPPYCAVCIYCRLFISLSSAQTNELTRKYLSVCESALFIQFD